MFLQPMPFFSPNVTLLGHITDFMGAERDHLASVISSAVNFRSHDDIVTLTAAAATALRGAATLKARALKEVLNVVAVLPVERGTGVSINGGKLANNKNLKDNYSEELASREDFLSSCSQELLAKGAELLKPAKVTFIGKLSLSISARQARVVIVDVEFLETERS